MGHTYNIDRKGSAELLPDLRASRIQAFGIVILGVIIALFLAHHYLDAFSYAEDRIWGDAGDGFFNLWVLNHVVETLPRQPGSISDGRIFWPDHARSFFWSDNLIVFAPFHAISRFFSDNPFAAFRLTGILLFFFHFAALVFFFYQGLALLCTQGPKMGRTVWLAPVLAIIAQCSPAVLINHFLHIQNFAATGLFLHLGCMLASLRTSSFCYLPWQFFIILSLLYCTPYYALTAAILLGAWLIGSWASDADTLKVALWHYRLTLFVITALALPMFFAYLTAEGRAGLSAAAIRVYAVTLSDLFLPNTGECRRWLSALTSYNPTVNHERLAWLGPGLLAMCIAMCLRTFFQFKPWTRLSALGPIGWFFLISFLILIPKTRDLRPFLAWYGLLMIGLGMVLAIIHFARRSNQQPLRAGMLYLIMAIGLLYGIALGPRAYYVNQPVNPSIWGFFALWMPGFDSMRAIGRMAYPGQVALILLMAMLAVNYGRTLKRRRLWFAGFCILCLSAQLWDSHAIRPPEQRHPPEKVIPTSEERAFFESIAGSILVLPAHPFIENTRHMLFFQYFSSINLMNGYSGHSTELWDRLMALKPDAQQEVALQAGADYIAIRTDRVSYKPESDQVPKPMSSVFQNDRWLVLER